MQLNIQHLYIQSRWNRVDELKKILAGLSDSAVCMLVNSLPNPSIVNVAAFLMASMHSIISVNHFQADKPASIIILDDVIVLKRCRKWRVLGYRTRPCRFAVLIRVGFSTGEFRGKVGWWGKGWTLIPFAWYSSVWWMRRHWARQISCRRIHLEMEIK